MKNFEKCLQAYRSKINKFIDKKLRFINPPNDIVKAMVYSMCSNGKRIRPILTLSVYEMLGGKDNEEILPIALAIEFVHAYSLVHDDLPCMDDSDLRRGLPTCHKVYGESMAVLVGDALLTYAYEIISEDFSKDHQIILELINYLSKSAGYKGMVLGQAKDLVLPSLKSKPLVRDLFLMHRMKTGKLIEFSVVSAAKILKVEKSKINCLRRFSRFLGLAFQIKDDILDSSGDVKILGKPAKQDIESSKHTFVTLLGEKKSQKILDKLFKKCILSLEKFGEENSFLIDFTNYLFNREI